MKLRLLIFLWVLFAFVASTSACHAQHQRTQRSYQPTISQQSMGSSNPYRLDAGDTLAIIIQGVLGDFQSAPIHLPKGNNGIIACMGHPIPVREDGTLSLPMIDPINVRGLSVTEAEKAVEAAYLREEILTGKNRVTVNLMRKRRVQVLVVHDGFSRGLPGENPRQVSKVYVPGDNATTLDALAESGGYFDSDRIQVLRNHTANPNHSTSQLNSNSLVEGDIVDAHSAETGFFFAGGQLRGGRYVIPAGATLNAAQAIAQAGGQLGGDSFGPSELILTRGGRSASYNVNWLLNNPSAVMIQPDDTITLRQTGNDIIGNSAIDILQFGILRGTR